jgi:hypothetical protein
MFNNDFLYITKVFLCYFDILLFYSNCVLYSLYVLFQSLLSMESAKEKENKKLNEEILELLTKPTAKV